MITTRCIGLQLNCAMLIQSYFKMKSTNSVRTVRIRIFISILQIYLSYSNTSFSCYELNITCYIALHP